MNYLDDAYHLLWDWIAGYSADAAVTLAAALFAVGAVIVAVVLIRRLLPYAIRILGIPLLVGALAFLGTLFLGLQLAAARLCRLFGARPPSFVYAAGDITVAALSRLRRIRIGLAPALYRLETFSFGIILIGVVVLLWRWNVTYCDRLALSPCTSPMNESYSALSAFVESLRA
jgi:hypothetical protein